MNATQGLKGRRLRLLFFVSAWIVRLGFGPSAAKITGTPVEARKANKAAGWTTYPLPRDVAMVYDRIESRSGPLLIKKYQPPQLNRDAPRVLFLHGGGWILGGVDTLDHLCAKLSRSVQCRIVSVDYRLAPETPFPGGLEDCYDALQWLASDASLGPMPAGGIAVVGESAGANLAAALCVLAARRGGPAIRHQTLIYPCVDATLSSPSMNDGPPGFRKKDIQQLIGLYRGAAALTDPLLSPLFAENHAQLPPALIITADLDPARDDGERYAQCLNAAGVPARYLNYSGMPHGFFFMPRICKAEAEAHAEISATLAALAGGRSCHDLGQ
ncbi:alpha/beta hydrolase [Hydrocarboniphaga sp.]|uniref:alpha/beta hydrolase n=1 Tax=Hydrocarboniphaga sp. TaxID=2033016 RepID=UPI003D0ECBFA